MALPHITRHIYKPGDRVYVLHPTHLAWSLAGPYPVGDYGVIVHEHSAEVSDELTYKVRLNNGTIIDTSETEIMDAHYQRKLDYSWVIGAFGLIIVLLVVL